MESSPKLLFLSPVTALENLFAAGFAEWIHNTDSSQACAILQIFAVKNLCATKSSRMDNHGVPKGDSMKAVQFNGANGILFDRPHHV